MIHYLNIYTSNRLEILAEQLARIVREPLPSAISPEIIVVQSRGMEQWVSMALARHNGICANCAFLFPNAFLQELFKNLVPELPDKTAFDPAVLTFRVMKMLPTCIQKPGFESLRTYLENDSNNLKLFQISEKIADLYDQYLVFRPEMIFDWEQGREDHWQARLWRLLVSGQEPLHRARLRKALIEKIKKEPDDMESFPGRVSIFGISYLPPFYLEVFVEISRLNQLNLFLMNPCKEYWADIVADRDIKKIRQKYSDLTDFNSELYLEKGNRLLASMGALGRDFQRLVSGLDGRIYEQYEDPVGQDVLAKIQADILSLKDRGIPDGSNSFSHAESFIRPPDHHDFKKDIDTSIQVHSCHSPMREIEALHDNLLAMFEEDPDLEPRDIIVMTPDMELYGPYIRAVFGAQIDEALRIPFSIADQSIRTESRVIDGFLSILDLPNSRFSVSCVLSLLQVPGIKEKFGLSQSDIEIAEHWIKATHIRWGVDAQHRDKLGLPSFSENTWRAGIERLLLGYALPGTNRRMFAGILPYDHIEGSDARILGKFLEFLERLFDTAGTLQQIRCLAAWHATLFDIIEQFFALDEESERDMQVLRRRIDELTQYQDLSGFDTSIEIHVIRSYLGNLLKREPFRTGFITSGVTFCAMLPMRSIPFKVICLVGMDSDAFPRESKQLHFDLMAQKPRSGDRSRRNDDKYMFLEALISARKKLYISFVGQSIQDNTQAPPSVLVSELLDYVQDGFGLSSEQVITRHRLQAFSPAYFTENTGLFSYSKENFAAADSRPESHKVQPLISARLAEPTAEWKRIDIDMLCAFFRNPARFLLEKRLGIYLAETTTIPEEREHFSLSGLEEYLLGQDLVENSLSGMNLADELPLYRAEGRLPHGNVGEMVYNEMSVDAKMFARKITKYTKGELPEALKVDLEIAGFHLTGRIANLNEGGLIRIHYAGMKSKYLLNTWIYHLILCVLVEDQHLPGSLLICRDAARKFDRVQNSLDTIEHLLSLYWKGMSEPLQFFPESSFEYAQRILNKKQTVPVALNAARQKWLKSDFSHGESEDPYYDLCFRNIDPIDEKFQSTAKDVFAPLLGHCREIIL